MRTAGRIAFIAFGYVVAVCVAVAVTEAIMLAPAAIPDGGANGSLLGLLPDLPGMFVIGFFWTFLCALPGFVVAIIIGERRGWSRWRDYATAGLLNVIPSLAFFWGFAGSPFSMPLLIVSALPGGFVGGVAYWIVAGRFVALGRRATTE
ncbi:MAG: hypothetical protein JNK47_10450 [Mesorhizobium sp.]|nr:hypothetical protein [Mesorhizobium sp.]MBL8577637.1 hypothetical protein [Mesorhizobium sp.]